MGSAVDSQSSDYNQIKMKSLLVFAASVLAVNGQFFGYPYAGYAANPLTYSYTPQVIKPVAKEIEVPVTTIEYGVAETGCKNVFGFPVPCLAEGEARKKRDADAEADAAVLYAGYPGYYGHGLGYAGYYGHGLGYAGYYGHPYSLGFGCHNVAGVPVPCARKRRDADEEEAAAPAATTPLVYAGHPFGLGYAGYPYAGLGYAGLGYPYAAPALKINEPEVTEVEYPVHVLKPVVKKVDLAPLCHNGLGFPVPCA